MYQIPKNLTNPYLFTLEALSEEMDKVSDLITHYTNQLAYWEKEEDDLRRINSWIERSPNPDDCELTSEANAVLCQQEIQKTKLTKLKSIWDFYNSKYNQIILNR